MTLEPGAPRAEPGAGLVTRGFLFADLRGYTAYVEANGDAAGSALLDDYRLLVRDTIAHHGGAEIRTEGDSFYVVFPSASSAVAGGLGIAAAAANYNTTHPERPIHVGVGVHAGEAVEAPEGYVGSAVNIAARVCAQAGPGEVLVSETVRSLIRTSGRLAFSPKGRRQLKGIAEPIALFRVEAAGALPAKVNGRGARDPRLILALGAGVLGIALAIGLFVRAGGTGPLGTAGPSASVGPSPSPQLVDRIAFAREFPGVDFEPCTSDFAGLLESHLWVAGADGKDPVRVATDANIWDRAPAWAPGGARLAFWGGAGYGDLIAVSPATGGNQTQLTPADGSNGSALFGPLLPSWSPDGAQILFVTNGAVVEVNAAGGSMTSVLGTPLVLYPPFGSGDPTGAQPTPSPRSPGPAVVSQAEWLVDGGIGLIGDRAFWSADADGTGARRIGDLPAIEIAPASIGSVAWSSDGSRVAFAGRPAGSDAVPWDIYVAGTDGSGLVQLTKGPSNDIEPAWSPDGERLAFASNRAGEFDLYTMAVDGSDVRRITEAPADAADCSPTWTRADPAVFPRPSPALVAGASPAPSAFHRGRLDAGEFFTDQLTPKVSFRLDEGWSGYISTPDEIVFQERGGPIGATGGTLIEVTIAKLQEAYDPPCIQDQPPVPTLVGPTTRDLITWLAGVKLIKVSVPEPVNLAGLSGLQFDLTPSGPMDTICPNGAGHRLHLFQAGNDSVWVRDGQKLRVTALDVNGTTMTILAGGPANDFDAAMTRLAPIIGSIRFTP
jgi:class 3 adenylate cyclase